MPRHGTATPEAVSTPEPVPASTRTAGSGRGMSGWPIRRKLAALVAPPLILILAAGGVLGVGAYDNLRAAQDAQRIADAIIAAGKANLALQKEANQALIGSALAASEGASTPTKNNLATLDTLSEGQAPA